MTTRDNVTRLNTGGSVYDAALRKAEGRILGFEHVLLRNLQYAVWYVRFVSKRPFPAGERVGMSRPYYHDVISHVQGS